MSFKKVGKAVLCLMLEAQVRRLRRHKFTVVAVAGSVGKTSTKFVIAQALAGTQRVLYQAGNYNDRLTVPLVLFGHEEPGIFNIPAWIKILLANHAKLRQTFPYDIVVLELGTDAPGQLEKFAYLKPDISIITAIAAEHMESFGTLSAVAKEELTPLSFSRQALLNISDIPSQYLPSNKPYETYGLQPADFAIIDQTTRNLASQTLICQLSDGQKLDITLQLLGTQGAKSAVAALAVTKMLGLPIEATVKELAKITAVAGRMQIVEGKNDSTIIDDTYNASPTAVIAALEVLYTASASQRVAILGDMNELGDESAADHQQVGEACDPHRLNLLVTIGALAREYLAPSAEQKGCNVKCFDNPYEAGQYVSKQLKSGAVILAKGSQNGVFAEEALKPLLKNSRDSAKLVRQSDYWLRQKQRQFGRS